jgi:hypothetical protein
MAMMPSKFGSDGLDFSDVPPDVEAVPVVSPTNAAGPSPSSKIDPLVSRFLRSLHVLIRAERLYQRNHPRMTESLEAADRDLRSVLAQVPALSIKVERDALIAATRESPRNSAPLPDPRGEMKLLAAELSGAGIASLVLLRRANLGELAQLAHALDAASRTGGRSSIGRSGPRHTDWAAWLAEHQIVGIQINSSSQRRDETVLAILLGGLRGAQASAATGVAGTAEQTRAALQFCAALALRLEQAQKSSPQDAARIVHAELAAADPRVLTLLSSAALHDPPLEGDTPRLYLDRVSDALAVEFVTAEYLADRLGAAEVRSALAELEASGSSDIARETRTETRLDRFWSSLPARAVARVLASPEAWCLPIPVLRRYLAPLLAAEERRRAAAAGNEARRALVDFLGCLQNDRERIRRTVAAGLVELSDVLPRLWPHPKLDRLPSTLVAALARESSPAAAVLLATAIENLAKLALQRRSYTTFEQILDQLGAIPRDHSEPVQPLVRRLSESQFWTPLVDAALENRPLDPALPRLLQRDPTRLLDRLGSLLAAPQGPNALPAMARLVRATGEAMLRALETDLCGLRRQRIAAAVKLLSAAAPERLAAAVPRTLAGWDWNLQDLAVTELSRHPDPVLRRQLARTFLELLPQAHLHVVPGMIDLIALAHEDSAVPRLIELATAEMNGAQDDFIRIKAIEALGRLRAASAVPRLREMATKRSGLTYAYPAGLRSAAEEALDLIEGRSGSAHLVTPPNSAEKTGPQFARPRRYQRVPLSSPLPASIEGPRGAQARVRAIALGGALVETGTRLAIGDSMQIEIHSGLGRIRSTAVVRNANPEGYGVEFVHMEEQDREKLRRRLIKLLH